MKCCIASGVSPLMAFPVRACSRWTKLLTSRGISSLRSRKGGDPDRNHIDPEIQIFPKLLLFDQSDQILMGGRYDTDVHIHGPMIPHPFDLFVFQHPQQLDLDGQRDIADFIQKDRAAVRRFKTSLAMPIGPGKSPFDVAEQLAFQKGGIQGGAVELHVRSAFALAPFMDSPGDKLFAGAALAGDDHGRIALGRLFHHLKNLADGGRGADDPVVFR